jgi:hypothetical protein
MGKVVLFVIAGFTGLVAMYPQTLKSWAHSTQDAAGSSISV